MKTIFDNVERVKSLDVSKSVLVKAGAGSGKTESLIQRILKLLSIVSSPEAVAAFTFTTKAAGEMRSRILSALDAGLIATPPVAAHEKLTWTLARAVIERDKALGWGLLDNPNRLNIQTIDAFCANLTRKMPVLSQFGAQPDVANDSSDMYEEASTGLLSRLENVNDELDLKISRALDVLLSHLDNNYGRVVQMMRVMLARRDQWLPHVVAAGQAGSDDFKLYIEDSLNDALSNSLIELSDLLRPYESSISELASFAADQLHSTESKIKNLSSAGLPDPSDLKESFKYYSALNELLLTSEGKWRKKPTKNIGFPAPSSAKGEEKELYATKKSEFIELLEQISSNEQLRSSLVVAKSIPSEGYTNDQWMVLESLIDILPILVAELHEVFRKYGKVDYAEISTAALRALGSSDNDGDVTPTDLGLLYDNVIEHILVDEFQDTNQVQMQLIRMLTAGWEKNDHKTLYLVGDPMQSIYRFREADVGLFLAARDNGIGNVDFLSVSLSVNFRSQSKHVDAVNDIFSKIMPKEDNISSGAVSYSPAHSFHDASEGEAINFLAFTNQSDRNEEAQAVCDIVNEIRKTKDEDVCVLVRGRNHLRQIVSAFNHSGISYRAVDIDPLSERLVIRDLLSLTKAITHPADSLAWFSLLRSPLVGLDKSDLLMLSSELSKNGSVFNCLINDSVIDRISSITIDDIKNVSEILSDVIMQRGRRSLRQWIEGAWIALGGSSYANESDLQNAATYFDLLDEVVTSSDNVSIEAIESAVSRLYAAPDKSSDGRVQLMTIHKSKGLQFDNVILPGLDLYGGIDEDRLLLWQERTNKKSERKLLLAPVNGSGDKGDSIYKYIKHEEKLRAKHEVARLLYVACTRAKNKTFLLANVKADESGEFVKPDSRALLSHLWDYVENLVVADTATTRIDELYKSVQKDDNVTSKQDVRFNSKEFNGGDLLKRFRGMENSSNGDNTPDFKWEPSCDNAVGIVVHRVLSTIHNGSFPAKANTEHEISWRNMLLQNGVTNFMATSALNKVKSLVSLARSDDNFKFLMASSNKFSYSEKPVSCVINDEVMNLVVDLTFEDKDGDRWIVDYKTGSRLEDQSLESFLEDQTKAHSEKLDMYESACQTLGGLNFKKALYFPGEQLLHVLNS